MNFRDGYPEDYITFTTKINYFPYTKLDEKIQQVEKFFEDILPEQHTREYVPKFLGTCLQGHVPDEKFYIWTGSGGNGKSLTIKSPVIHIFLPLYCGNILTPLAL